MSAAGNIDEPHLLPTRLHAYTLDNTARIQLVHIHPFSIYVSLIHVADWAFNSPMKVALLLAMILKLRVQITFFVKGELAAPLHLT